MIGSRYLIHQIKTPINPKSLKGLGFSWDLESIPRLRSLEDFYGYLKSALDFSYDFNKNYRTENGTYLWIRQYLDASDIPIEFFERYSTIFNEELCPVDTSFFTVWLTLSDLSKR